MDLPIELIKQAPTLAALIWLVSVFLKDRREERSAFLASLEAERKACETSRQESRTDFLCEIKRTHEMYRGKEKA